MRKLHYLKSYAITSLITAIISHVCMYYCAYNDLNIRGLGFLIITANAMVLTFDSTKEYFITKKYLKTIQRRKHRQTMYKSREFRKYAEYLGGEEVCLTNILKGGL